jgi:hypothetical protein
MRNECSESSSDAPLPKKSFRGKKALQVGIGAVCVAFVIATLVKEREVLLQARAIAPADIIALFVLLIGYFVLYAYRFVLLIEKHCGCRIGLLAWIRMLVVVRFLNNMVPQMGSIHRGIALKRDFGVSYTDYIAANLFFIWSDTVLNFVIALLLFWGGATSLELFGLSAGAFLALSSGALVATPFLAHLVIGVIPNPPKLIQKLGQVAEEVVRGAKDLRYMLSTACIAVASFLITSHVFRVLLGTVGAEVDLATLAVFYALYRLTFHINITPGNVGIREIAYGLLCAQAHIGMSKGLLIAAELRVLSILVLLIIAASVAGREVVGAFRLVRERKLSGTVQ